MTSIPKKPDMISFGSYISISEDYDLHVTNSVTDLSHNDFIKLNDKMGALIRFA